jgi:hypothetical protein
VLSSLTSLSLVAANGGKLYVPPGTQDLSWGPDVYGNYQYFLAATFPAGTVPPGVYNVRVGPGSNGAYANLPGAVTVVPGGGSNFEA